jgi:MFS family permease
LLLFSLGQVLANFTRTVRVMGDPRMLLLAPVSLFSGFELAFWTGEFPQLLAADSIGLVLSFAGLGEVLGGFFFGKMSDCAGRSATICLGLACFLTGLGLAAYLKVPLLDGTKEKEKKKKEEGGGETLGFVCVQFFACAGEGQRKGC